MDEPPLLTVAKQCERVAEWARSVQADMDAGRAYRGHTLSSQLDQLERDIAAVRGVL